MIRVLKVSKSGFYDWRKKDKSSQENKKLKLVRTIEDIHKASRGCYGSPRVFEQLKGLGFSITKSTLERLMRENNIKAKTKKRFKITTQSKHKFQIAENLINQNFNVTSPNKVWAVDISYIPTGEGWVFLSVVIDLFSRTVVGWGLSEKITKELALNALTMAYFKRKPPPGLIHHSDRGVQYACHEYQKLLKSYKMICSMSRKANCYDNAVVESFFHTLKTEFIYHENFQTREEAKRKIFEWIEVFYNRKRLHSTLNYKNPVDFEMEYFKVCMA